MPARLHRLVARLLIVCLAGLSLPAHAGMLSTDAALGTEQRARVATFLDREAVRAQLEAHGVSAADAKARLAAMSDQEVDAIAGRIEALPAGGDLLGVLLTVFIVLLITDILGFTKVFPFTKPLR